MEITFFPNRGSNPVRWTQSPTLYQVALKAGLYRKAVQVRYIPIPGDSLPLQPASVAHLDALSDCRPGGRGFNPRRGRQHSFVEIDHEIFSTLILSLPLTQEGQLSVSGQRMCTILVNRLEDYACPVNVWLGKLTALDMTPLGWLGRKTSTQTISPSNLKFVPESENHVEWDSRSFMYTCGLFTVGAKCNRWKNGNNIFPQPGIKPGPLDSKSYTLPRRYKSRLVLQGSTSVLYTYTRWHT